MQIKTSNEEEHVTIAETAAEAVGRFECSGDGRTVVGEVVRTSAGLAVSRVEISTDLPGGVTHEMLRKVPLAEFLAQARSQTSLFEVSAVRPIRVPPPGYVAMTSELLRDVARAYLEEGVKGSGVTERLQERFDRPKGTVITWISRARRDGWLGPSARGRIGAEPGPKLIAWAVKVSNCETCHGTPPAGFTCQACGSAAR